MTHKSSSAYGNAAEGFITGGVPGLVKSFGRELLSGGHYNYFGRNVTNEQALSFLEGAERRLKRGQKGLLHQVHQLQRYYSNRVESFPTRASIGADAGLAVASSYYPTAADFIRPPRRRRRKRKRYGRMGR